MTAEKNATDFLIECENPESFDRTINQLGAAALVENGGKGQYLKKEGYYVMRVFGNAGFLKFSIQNQGYGKIIKELENLV